MRIFTSILVAAALIGTASAQITTDSIQTGGSYANDIYYDLETGTKTERPNNEWQLAFSLGTFNAAVRTNAATGSTSDGSVVVYEVPGTDISKWSSFDTTPMRDANGNITWSLLNNSDEDWQGGALNSNSTSQFDYGWGLYDVGTHIISAQRLYLAVVKSGTSILYKKIWVRNKTIGTWNISFANLDGTDSVGLSMATSTYNTKNFIYVSLVTGQIVDREPARDKWDFVYTRYAGLQPTNPPQYYPSVGILTKGNLQVAELRKKSTATASLADTVSFSANISTIGADWKTGLPLTAVDSLTYFIKVTNGDIWKVYFTKFESGSSPSGTGKAVFNKEKVYKNNVGLSNSGSISTFAVYPNPASDVVNVLFDVTEANSTVSVMDLSGRTLHTENVSGKGFIQSNINVSSYAKGIYFISISNGSSRSVQKVVVQ